MQVFLQILCDFCFTRLGLEFLCVGSEYIFLNCQNFNLVLCCVITRFNCCSSTRFICVLHGSLTEQVAVLCYVCFVFFFFLAKFVFVFFLLQQSRKLQLGGHFLFVLPSDFEVSEFCFHPSLSKDF
jgi:hypothetical protein